MKKILITISCLLLSGCFHHVKHNEEARIVYPYTTLPFDYDDQTGIYPLNISKEETKTANIKVSVTVKDVLKGQNIYDDGKAYWIGFQILFHGKRSHYRHYVHADGSKTYIPVRYDVNQVYLDIGNGQKLIPERVFYLGQPRDFSLPGKETVASPVDFNGQGLTNNGNPTSLTQLKLVYIKFPYRLPAASNSKNLSLHLGYIEVGGVKVALGEASYRVRPAADYVVRYKGAF